MVSCNLRKQVNNDVIVAQVDETDTSSGIFTNIKIPGGIITFIITIIIITNDQQYHHMTLTPMLYYHFLL